MFSHITVGCSDLGRASTFYDALLQPLGLMRRAVAPDGGPASACWVHPELVLPRFYVYLPRDGLQATPGNGSMLAFSAGTPAIVRAAYSAGLRKGGTDEGAPGERPWYGKGYYGAYLRDPDGNKLHIVHRGDLACSW
jgi:catechol 2,3-dioxygenase-like lactoylglutathione lyase family enzyme